MESDVLTTGLPHYGIKICNIKCGVFIYLSTSNNNLNLDERVERDVIIEISFKLT